MTSLGLGDHAGGLVESADVGLQIADPVRERFQALRPGLIRRRASDQHHARVELLDQTGGEDQRQSAQTARHQEHTAPWDRGLGPDRPGRDFFQRSQESFAMRVADVERFVAQLGEQDRRQRRRRGRAFDTQCLETQPGLFETQTAGIGPDGLAGRIAGCVQMQQTHWPRAPHGRLGQTMQTPDAFGAGVLALNMEDDAGLDFSQESFVVFRPIRTDTGQRAVQPVIGPGTDPDQVHTQSLQRLGQFRAVIEQQYRTARRLGRGQDRGRRPPGPEQQTFAASWNRSRVSGHEPLDPRQCPAFQVEDLDVVTAHSGARGSGSPADGETTVGQRREADDPLHREGKLQPAVDRQHRQALEGAIEQCRMQTVGLRAPVRRTFQQAPDLVLARADLAHGAKSRTIVQTKSGESGVELRRFDPSRTARPDRLEGRTGALARSGQDRLALGLDRAAGVAELKRQCVRPLGMERDPDLETLVIRHAGL